METKKTAVITFRTQEEIKEALNECAKQNQWSQAQVVEQICKNFLVNPEPFKITIWAKDLLEMAKELQEEGCGGVELSIDLKWDEKTETYYKELNAYGLEGGGFGSILFNTCAKDLTDEEKLDIP